MEGKGEAWEGRDGRKGGEDDGKEERARHARDLGKQKEVCQIFTGEFAPLHQGEGHPVVIHTQSSLIMKNLKLMR
jgi:hypothetical protein